MVRPNKPEYPQTPQRPSVDQKAVKSKIVLGDFHFKRGEYDDAIAAYREGLGLDPSNAEIRQKVMNAIKACKSEDANLGATFRCN